MDLFPAGLRSRLEHAKLDPELLQEIRMRANRPLLLRYGGKEYGLTMDGKLTLQTGNCAVMGQREVKEALEHLAGYSLYAYDEEVKQGYFTVPGGHRVGVAGRVVMEGGHVQCIRHISFLNIRFAHQKKGCADELMPYLIQDGSVCHTLLISPPGCGKTTMLRDVIRQISNGTCSLSGLTVGVVDVRSELAGAYLGIPQNDLGMRTDVLDGCLKSEGIQMLLRSMAPQVIAVDEIGGEEDLAAVRSALYCGCRLIATAHGASYEEVRKRTILQSLIERQVFDRYVFLAGREQVGRLRAVFGRKGELLMGQAEAA